MLVICKRSAGQSKSRQRTRQDEVTGIHAGRWCKPNANVEPGTTVDE
jgi:hypothetical protein